MEVMLCSDRVLLIARRTFIISRRCATQYMKHQVLPQLFGVLARILTVAHILEKEPALSTRVP